MNLRQGLKVLKNGRKYRLSTFRQAAMKVNKYAPKWAQSLEISGVVCHCWADGLVVCHKNIRR